MRTIEELREETGFDEDVIGCFLSNYKVPHVCPIATGKWCRDYTKCKSIEEGINRRIKEQQDYNEHVANEKEKFPAKTKIMMIIAAVLVICDLSLIYWIIEKITRLW